MSGEIIQMNNKQNMIFEPQDLEQASPATVSRCGMIYMEPNELGWQPVVDSWLETDLPDVLNADQRYIIKVTHTYRQLILVTWYDRLVIMTSLILCLLPSGATSL